MNFRKSVIALALVGVASSSFGAGLVDLGTVTLNNFSYTSGNGPFKWDVVNDSINLFNGQTSIYTYCFSEANYLYSPVTFHVYSFAGATAADLTASAFYNVNSHPGLTGQHLLQAAAQAQYFGNATALNATTSAYNDAIHFTESNGGYNTTTDTSRFYYLSTDSTSGQPQGFVKAVPEPFTMALTICGLGLAVRRRTQKKSA